MNLTPRDKQELVQSLWSIWNEGGAALEQLPKTIKSILDTKAWDDREVEGKAFKNASFREFIISPPLKGCGWENQTDAIQEVLDLKDPRIAGKFRRAMAGGRGARNDLIEPSSNGTKLLRGNTKPYTLDRLERDYPELFERVVVGELSANAAAIEAGFRKKPKKHCPKCGYEW